MAAERSQRAARWKRRGQRVVLGGIGVLFLLFLFWRLVLPSLLISQLRSRLKPLGIQKLEAHLSPPTWNRIQITDLHASGAGLVIHIPTLSVTYSPKRLWQRQLQSVQAPQIELQLHPAQWRRPSSPSQRPFSWDALAHQLLELPNQWPVDYLWLSNLNVHLRWPSNTLHRWKAALQVDREISSQQWTAQLKIHNDSPQIHLQAHIQTEKQARCRIQISHAEGWIQELLAPSFPQWTLSFLSPIEGAVSLQPPSSGATSWLLQAEWAPVDAQVLIHSFPLRLWIKAQMQARLSSKAPWSGKGVLGGGLCFSNLSVEIPHAEFMGLQNRTTDGSPTGWSGRLDTGSLWIKTPWAQLRAAAQIQWQKENRLPPYLQGQLFLSEWDEKTTELSFAPIEFRTDLGHLDLAIPWIQGAALPLPFREVPLQLKHIHGAGDWSHPQTRWGLVQGEWGFSNAVLEIRGRSPEFFAAFRQEKSGWRARLGIQTDATDFHWNLDDQTSLRFLGVTGAVDVVFHQKERGTLSGQTMGTVWGTKCSGPGWELHQPILSWEIEGGSPLIFFLQTRPNVWGRGGLSKFWASLWALLSKLSSCHLSASIGEVLLPHPRKAHGISVALTLEKTNRTIHWNGQIHRADQGKFSVGPFSAQGSITPKGIQGHGAFHILGIEMPWELEGQIQSDQGQTVWGWRGRIHIGPVLVDGPVEIPSTWGLGTSVQAQGRIELTVPLSWKKDASSGKQTLHWLGQLHLQIPSLELPDRQITVQGLTTSLQVQGTNRWIWSQPQQIQIKKVQIGPVPLQNIRASIAVHSNLFQFTLSHAEVLGGQLRTEPIRWRPGQRQVHGTLIAQGIRIDEVLKLFPKAPFQATGRLSGQISLSWDRGRWTVLKGHLVLAKGAPAMLRCNVQNWLTRGMDPGSSRYQQLRLVEEAMQDLRLKRLEIALQSLDLSQPAMQIHIEGEGHARSRRVVVPVILDLPIRGDVFRLLEMLQSGNLSVW